jgi:hypothetical protein
MANVAISQLPPTLFVNGATDYLEVSQFVGPPINYASRKILANIVNGPTVFSTKGTFTLQPNATATIVPLTGCLPTSSLCGMPWPMTMHAANAVSAMFFTMGTNQFTVTHANNAFADKQFGFVLFY